MEVIILYFIVAAIIGLGSAIEGYNDFYDEKEKWALILGCIFLVIVSCVLIPLSLGEALYHQKIKKDGKFK